MLTSQGVITSTIASGYQDLLVAYTSNAYKDIQTLRTDWDFLHTTVDITLTTGKTDYSIFDIFGTTEDPVANWERVFFEYKALRAIQPWEYTTTDWASEDPSKPTKYAKPIENNTLIFNNLDRAYAVTAHYFAKPQVLVNNTDTLLMPSEFENAIIYRAVADVGLKLGIIEVFQLFDAKANVILGALMRVENPGKRIKIRGLV